MATKSNGVTVTVGGTAIGGLVDVNITGGDVNAIDTTVHGDAARTFVGGLTDFGTLELSGKYNIADTGQLALIAGTGDTAAFVVTYNDSGDSTATFSAIIGAFNLSNPLDDTVDFSCSCKITGVVAIAA
jgi:hypothetical protein